MLNLNRLAHVVAVAREGSYSSAARTIPISQSALTRSVQMVETEYRLQIFERGRLGVQLTDEGAHFIRLTEAILRRTTHDDDELRSLRDSHKVTVRFGLGSISASVFLPRLLPKIHQLGVRHTVVVESNATLRELLRRGEIDFYMGGVPLGSDAFGAANGFTIDQIPSEMGMLGLFVREGHPLLQEAVPAHHVRDYPIAAGSFVREILAEPTFAGLGLELPVIEMDNYDLLATLARDTDFVLVASGLLYEARPDLGLTPLTVSLPAPTQLGWAIVSSARVPLRGVAKEIASLIRDQIR